MIKQNCGDTEGEPEPGMERPVQAKEECNWQIRCTIQKRDADRIKVGKQVSQLSRKAAIVFIIPVP